VQAVVELPRIPISYSNLNFQFQFVTFTQIATEQVCAACGGAALEELLDQRPQLVEAVTATATQAGELLLDGASHKCSSQLA
jgi:hypothetical protein